MPCGTAAPDDMHTHRRLKCAAAVMFTTFICAEVTYVLAMVSGPTFQRVMSLSSTQLGICLGAMPMGALVMSLVIGHATGRLGPYRVLTLGLVGLICGLGMILLAREMATLLVALVFAGLAVAAIANAGLTLLSDVFPVNTRRVMALAAALWFASSALAAPLIGAWLALAHVRGLTHWSYGLPGTVAMALLAACLLLVHTRLSWTTALHRRAARAEQTQGLRGYRWLWMPALAYWHGTMVITFIAWANPMIQATFSTDDFRGSLAFAMFAVGLAAGRLLVSRRRLITDDRVLLGMSGIGGSLLLALALNLPTYHATLVAIAVGAFVASATAPCLYSLVAGQFPAMKARLYGYQEASIAAGGMVGPAVVGLLVDLAVPVRTALLISPLGGAVLGLGGLIWRAIDRSSETHRDPEEPKDAGAQM